MYNEIEYTIYIFDEYGYPTFYVEKEEWLPNPLYDKDLSPAEIAKKKIEGRKLRVVEQEIKYYD